MTGKNGKVLGVTLDAQDHEQAEWVTPSGGGLVVTMTEDQNNPGTYVGDKTFNEIETAFEAGRNVVVGLVGLGSVLVVGVTIDGSSIEVECASNGVSFTGTANEYPSITP